MVIEVVIAVVIIPEVALFGTVVTVSQFLRSCHIKPGVNASGARLKEQRFCLDFIAAYFGLFQCTFAFVERELLKAA